MKKKVLIVTKHLRIGGTEKMLLRALPIWNSLGFDIDILLLYNDITLLDDELNNYNISFIFSEKSDKAKQKMKEVPDLIYQKYIKKDYDIEIAFQEGFPTKLISRSTNSRSKKIAWVHSVFKEYHFSSSAYENNKEESMSYENFDKIVFCSHNAQQSFNLTLNVKTQKQEVIYSPADYHKLTYQSNEYTPDLTYPYFLVLSRLSPQKGIDRLLQAARQLTNQGLVFNILIIGSGELEENTRCLVKKYQLEQNIALFPAMSNPYPFLKDCLAYICPSFTESFGLSIQEALCLAKPVIACKTTGAVEVLMNGEFGEVVSPSSLALSEAIKSFLVDSFHVKNLQRKAEMGCAYWQNQEIISRKQLSSVFTTF